MKPPHVGHDLMTRAQVQVIGIIEDESKPKILHVIRFEPLDGTQRADWHEGRCFDLCMAGREQADAALGVPIGLLNVVLHHLLRGLTRYMCSGAEMPSTVSPFRRTCWTAPIKTSRAAVRLTVSTSVEADSLFS